MRAPKTSSQTGSVVPAQEMLTTVLEQHLNRYRAIAGAAQNAKQAGNEQKIAHYAELLLKLAEYADSPRSEIAEAKHMLGM